MFKQEHKSVCKRGYLSNVELSLLTAILYCSSYAKQ